MNKKLAAIMGMLLLTACLCACGKSPEENVLPAAAPEVTCEPEVTGTVYHAVFAEKDGKTISTDRLELGEISLELLSNGTCALELGAGRSDGLWTAEGEKLSLSFEDTALNGTISAGIVVLSLELPGAADARLTMAEPWLAGGLRAVEEESTEIEEPEPEPVDPMEWWSGSWYGWWGMYRQEGEYTGLESDWWDLCAEISFDHFGNMTMVLWDSDGSYEKPAGSVTFRLEEGSDMGTAVSQYGRFFGQYIGENAWIVSPAQTGYSDTILIEPGSVRDYHGSYRYRIILRRWGSTWDELEGDPNRTVQYLDVYPAHYEDWYMPLIRQGAAMPDSIGG